ncbi:MAG: hypothetical protein ACOCZQ_03310 [Nanoarchaeota archaeon]
MDFVDFFELLGELGMWDTFLPFLLIFTIFFAVLQKTQVLGSGEDSKKFNLIISAVIGFLVVIPHVTDSYPHGKDVVVIINSALPDVVAVVIAVVLALIMANLFTHPNQNETLFAKAGSWAPYLALVIVGYIFAAKWGLWDEFFYLNDATIQLVIILLVFGLVFFFIWRGGDND